jgi:hypothetical protein
VKKMFRIIGVIIPLVSSSLSASTTYTCTKEMLPLIQKGCEGEGCGILEYDKAIKTVKLYKKPSFQAPVAGELKECEVIPSFEPYIVVRKWGAAEVTSVAEEDAALKIQAGDTIALKSYSGEGYYWACINKTEFKVGTPGSSNPVTVVEVISKPVVETWIKVGAQRYAPRSEEFFIHHYNNYDNLKCPEDREKPAE